MSEVSLSVYLHLPWCIRKCPYCDFNSHTAGPAAQRSDYIDALVRDIEREAARARGRAVQSVFIGGGTPSLFSPGEIDRILDALASRLRLADDAEITMEANPGTVERGSMRGYRSAGVNRISLGAQSFDDGMLQRLGRIHSSADIVSAIREIRRAGFEAMNLDIMYSLPGQSLAQSRADVRKAIELEPGHLSHYQLSLEPNTVFSARPPKNLPDDDLAWEMQEACHAVLANAGYRQYEVSAFARPGQECRHNLNYWRFGEYLGIGAGAHGLVRDGDGRLIRTEKSAHPRQYVQEVAGSEDRTRLRHLTDDDALFEFMLNVLRLPEPFSGRAKRTGQPESVLRAAVEPAVEQGLLEPAGGNAWRSTRRGYRFLNDLQALFLPGEMT